MNLFYVAFNFLTNAIGVNGVKLNPEVFCCSKLPDTMEEALNLGKEKTTEKTVVTDVERTAETAEKTAETDTERVAETGMKTTETGAEKQGIVNRAMEIEEDPAS